MLPGAMTGKLLAVLALLLALTASHWYAYQSGNTHGTNAVLVKTQEASLAALTHRLSEHARLVEQYSQQAKKASEAHAQELATVRAHAKRVAGTRVPVDAGLFCPGPATHPEASAPGGTGQADPGTAFLPDTFAADLRELAEQADEVSADLRTLKERTISCFQ